MDKSGQSCWLSNAASAKFSAVYQHIQVYVRGSAPKMAAPTAATLAVTPEAVGLHTRSRRHVGDARPPAHPQVPDDRKAQWAHPHPPRPPSPPPLPRPLPPPCRPPSPLHSR